MKKRIVALISVVVLSATVLAGCGSTAVDSDELQAQLEELQAELDALKQESQELASVAEESSEEVVEESTEETVTTTAEVSTDWTNYSFSVNGKTLSLPCTYKELSEATGFEMKSSEAKSYLESGYYTYVNLYHGDEQLALYIDILNDTEEDACYADCLVVSVCQSEYQAVSQEASVLTFPGNLQVGQAMTTADVEAIFGAPQDTYEYISEDSDYVSYTWTYAEDPDSTYTNCFEICLVNGIVDEITLDNLYYEY